MANSVTLDKYQKQAIEHLEGPLLLTAPVGTGKTLVLSERVARAVELHKVAPHRVLCVTFTNRAAREMLDRLKNRLPPDAIREMTVRTFHSLCALILRCEAKVLGLPQDFVIYDEVDSEEVLRQLGCGDKESGLSASDAYRTLGDAKMSAAARDDVSGVESSALNVFATLTPRLQEVAAAYQSVLAERHALDFSDLVFQTRLLLECYADVRDRWEDRYDFIQVDEIQDTHVAEYQVLKILAAKRRNLALIGDLDQAIYGWRGVEPLTVVEQFKRDFDPVAQLPLVINYRSTRVLLQAASSFASCFETRFTSNTASEACEPGTSIEVCTSADERAEGRFIAQAVRTLVAKQAGLSYGRIGVLTRTNRRAQAISASFETMGVPHVAVEQYEFYRRQEIKDALAILRLICNPFDVGSARRVLLRLAPGVGDATIRHIIDEGRKVGLHITDLLSGDEFGGQDPLSPLLDAYAYGTITVLDIETTGLFPHKDEVIEIAATRLKKGKICGELDLFVRNTVPVGESESVHHITDDFLREHGESPEEAIGRFLEFADRSTLVGHNCSFDRTMLLCHARRLGSLVSDRVAALPYYDTLDLARRCVVADSYRLNDLAESLGLRVRGSHRAGDDVAATCELLAWLVPRIEAGSEARGKLAAAYVKLFQDLGERLRSLRQSVSHCRPPELLEKATTESGLRVCYKDDPKRLTHLDELVTIFRRFEDVGNPPEAELIRLIEHVTLSRNVDYLTGVEDRVGIITVHQAKGLEFDVVFLAGVVENEFPSYLALKEGRLEEEKRLFYVGITRARKRLYLAAHERNDRGYATSPSSFISKLPRNLLGHVRTNGR